MGWLCLFGIGTVAFVALRFAGLPLAFGGFAAAALILGGAGYALQQRADLPGQFVTARTQAIDVDPGMVGFRAMIMPAAPADAAVFQSADEQLRAGDVGAAVRTMLDAIGRRPNDPALWTGLGSALAAHDGGQVSPAAQFAFQRAMRLAPDQPGPPFFLGLAYVQAGELPAAKAAWLGALRRTPRDAPYRADIAERLAMLDQFESMVANSGQKP